MNKKNIVPLLGIAFVVAVVTTGIFYGLFVSKLDASASKVMVVTAREVKAGTVLSKEDIKTVPWAAEEMPKGSFDSTAKLIGQTSAQGIAEGEPVFESYLANHPGGASAAVPAGMRAVSSHVVDSTGVLTLVRPGSKVDIQALSPKGDRPAEAEIRTVLQNIAVLSVTPGAEEREGTMPAPVVTFLVTPAEADVLALADATTRVRIALRNPSDGEIESRGALGFQPMLRGTAKSTAVTPQTGGAAAKAAAGGAN